LGRVVVLEVSPPFQERNCSGAVCAGNVARFINHSCDPNLVKQIVYTEGCSALKYKMVLVAARCGAGSLALGRLWAGN